MSLQKEIYEQKEEIHNQVMLKSLKASGIAGLGGVFGHFGLTAYSQRYAKHRMPWKVFGLICIPMAVFFTSSEFYTRELDKDFSQKFSISNPVEREEKSYEKSFQGFREYFGDNQYSIIGSTWLGLVATSLAYNFSKPEITMQQKFINARMVSQSGALLGLVAVALLHVKKTRETVRDEHFEQIVNPKQ